MWDKGLDRNPEDKTSHTTQYQEAFLRYVENEYCAKHWRVPVNKFQTIPSSNPVPSATASGSYQSSFDSYDSSSDGEEYLKPNNVAETTPWRSDGAARLLTAARIYLNPPPEAKLNCGQILPNLNDYNSDPIEISSTFWIPDITSWCRQQEETHSKYADLCNVACDIFPIIGQFARANTGILAGTDPKLNTTNTENDSEMKKEAEERKLHRMAKVDDCLEMWQGSQNLHATQNESRSQNK